jgi:hypothetical protein
MKVGCLTIIQSTLQRLRVFDSLNRPNWDVVESNLKPLKFYTKVDQQSQLQLVLGQKYFPLCLWVLLKLNIHM